MKNTPRIFKVVLMTILVSIFWAYESALALAGNQDYKVVFIEGAGHVMTTVEPVVLEGL